MPTRMLLCVAVLALSSGIAHAVPGTMAFTARVSSGNVPVSNTVSMRFILYDAQTGGSSVWEETYDAVTVEDGLFFAALGSQKPLDATVFSGATLWLQIDVDGVPQEPRIGIFSVPYAARAGVADKLASLEGANVAAADHSHDYRAGLAAAGQLDGDNDADLVTRVVGDGRYLNAGECYLDLAAGGALDNNAGTDLLTRAQLDARYLGAGGSYGDLSAGGHLNGFDGTDLLTRSQLNSDFLAAGSAYGDLSASSRLNDDADSDIQTRIQADARFVNNAGSYADLVNDGRLDNNAGGDVLTRDQLDARYLNAGEELTGTNHGGCGSYTVMNCASFFVGSTGASCSDVAVGGICKATSASNACSLAQPHCPDGSWYVKTAP